MGATFGKILETMNDIFIRLRRETFSGKIAFLNPNSRAREFIPSGPPFGLMCLMGVCRDLSIPYGFIEADAHNLSDAEVIDAINAGKYEYVGVPLVSLRASKIFPLLERIKRETHVKLIVGGPLPTADTSWLMESCQAIDYAVIGEGEAVLPQLLFCIENNMPLDEIAGISYWEDDQLIATPRDTQCLPGEILPMPDFDVIDYDIYPGLPPAGGWPSMNIFATRGCPYKCTFCCNPIWSHKPKIIPVPIIINWLERLEKKGVREVFFADDTFNINHNWLEELCTSIIKSGLHQKMGFKSLIRADLTQPEQLELARKAGFCNICYGAESGNQRVLDYYRKRETVEDIAKAIEMTHAAGLKSIANFIAGAPIDTADTLLDTAKFIRQINPTYFSLRLLTPMIGAKIAEDIIARGILTVQEIRHYDHSNPTIRTETLSTKELLEIYDFICQDFLVFQKTNDLSNKKETKSHLTKLESLT
jgi:anaerobic magnesium-protoporphyrin IX monomethyl ester cyclase